MRNFLAVIIVMSIIGALEDPGACAEPGPQTVAVLELVNEAELTIQEGGYLTEVIRASARENLSIDSYMILTRQNIFEKLGKKSLAECIGECAVITGRNLDAAYVVAGQVVEFGNSIRINLTLHDTSDGNLIRSVQAKGATVEKVEEPLRRRCRELYEPLRLMGLNDSPGPETKLGNSNALWQAPDAEQVIVHLDSEPQGALVEIDGVGYCRTPCTAPRVEGSVSFRFSLERYVPTTRTVYVEPDMPEVHVELTPNFGWLTITSEPSGLAVTLDGEIAGKTPLWMRETEIGPHEVWLQEANWHRTGERLFVDRAEHQEIHLEPVPINGGLQVRAVDRNGNAIAGNVLVDGRVEGSTYTTLTLQSGDRTVEVHGDGGSKWRDTVTVPQEDLLNLDVLVRFPDRSAVRDDVSDIRIVTQPAGSTVKVEGEEQGSAPVSGIQLPPGKYRIRASRPMYESSNKTVYVEKPSHVFTLDLKPKTKGKAVLYSLLLPGLGQHYKEQHLKGWLYCIGVASAASIAVTNESARQGAVDEYDAAYASYLEAMTQDEMDRYYTTSQDAWARAEDSKRARNFGWIVVGAVWVWNVVDATLGWPASETGLTLDVVPDAEGNPRAAVTVWR